MLILRLRFALIAVVGAAALLLLLTLSSEPATAQNRAPLLQGPEATRPELLPIEPDVDDAPIPGRTLPRIHIPEDDAAAQALSGGMIAVRTFRFFGNTALSDAQLEIVTQSYLGEGRRYSALLEARDRITRAYVDAGYISSGAVLPHQDFADGVVEINIIEGQLTSIDITTDGRLRNRYFASRLKAAGGTLNVNVLRESLRRLKRDPRIAAVAAELIPGEQRGESVLSIAVDEAVPYWSSGSFDNYAPESIGAFRGRFRAGHRNVSGWGDTWSVAYSVAEGLHDVDLRVEVPVNRWDTSLEVWMRRAWSEIVEDSLASLDIESKTQAYGFRLRQPVLRMRGQEAGVFFSADWKRGRGFLAGSAGVDPFDPNKGLSTVAGLHLGGDYLLRLRRRAIAVRMTANVGINALSATKQKTSDFGEKFPDGQFVSGLLQIQAVEYLPWNKLRLQARLDAQVADAHLLGLEQFALGGHASVRGYRENLAVRDQGVVGSLELRIPLPLVKPIERLELGIFTDAGYGRDLGKIHGGATLVSVGLGLHADITPYVRASIEWAHDITDSNAVTGNELQDDGLHFSMQVRFP